MAARSMKHSPTIAVLDSGMGGLTVLKALRERMPRANFIYLFDNANFPYGTKSEAEVERAVISCIDRLSLQYPIDAIVIACNTASVSALPAARARFAVPIVGTVPAIKPAAIASKTKTIALLATPGTVGRSYTEDLARQFAQGCLLLRRGSSVLVQLAESKMHGQPASLDDVLREIQPLFEQSPAELTRRLDTIVLGCTHFPLLVDEIAAVAPWPVQLIDSGPAIAARTQQVLVELGFAMEAAAGPSLEALPPLRALATRLDFQVELLRPVFARLGSDGITAL